MTASLKTVSEMAPHTDFHSIINGEILEGDSSETLVDPSTGTSWGSVSWSSSHVELAVTAARAGLNSWSSTTLLQRADVLDRISASIAEHVEELAVYETLANGKPLHFTRAEVAVSSRWWQYYAALLRTLRDETMQMSATKQAIVHHEPIGIAALITPFNGAFSLGTWKLAPALAAGNAVIIKPPTNSPASSMLLQRIVTKAGVPKEAVQIVQGSAEVGAELTSHEGVDMVSFTGSTVGARKVGATTSGRLARFVAEAGGKSAHIIFDDADIDQAVTAVVQGVFSATGQTCVAGSRVFVHRDIAPKFTEKLLARVAQLRSGDPASSETHLGPIATERQYQHVLSLIDQAVADGATLLAGGATPPSSVSPELSGGYWVAPTVLKTQNSEVAICHTEVFGPVVVLAEFNTDDEVVELANNSDFGLAAGFWTSSASRAHRVSRALKAGTVWVNTYRGMDWQTPFGGFKQSGIGRENGVEGLREFQQIKSIVQEFGSTPDPFGLV